jgi:hypothetical protein
MKTNTRDPNQGEGDKLSARHYNRAAREFVAEGKVDEAAREAAEYVDSKPTDARRAEDVARKGPRKGPRVSVDELVAKGRTVFDRVRPVMGRVVDRVRARFSKHS